jgi:hypothetical protein
MVFVREALAGLDVERLVERCREDISSKHRRLSRATFEVCAFRVDGAERVELLRDALVIARDELEPDAVAASPEGMTVEGASVAMQAAAFAAAREAHRDLRDGMMSAMQTLQHVAEALSGKLVEAQDKVAAGLTTAFEFATLRHEREESAQASSERRELGREAIQQLAPIAGAALTHITKNATPAWGALAARIQTSGKLPKLLALLEDDPEALSALGSALGHTFPSKESQ